MLSLSLFKPKTPQDLALKCIKKMDKTRIVSKIIIEYTHGAPLVIINQNTTQSDSELYKGYKSLAEANITTLNDNDNIIYYYLKEVISTDPLNPVSKHEIAPLGLYIGLTKQVNAPRGRNGEDPYIFPANVKFEFKSYQLDINEAVLDINETVINWVNRNKNEIFINVGDEYVRISSLPQFYRNVENEMYFNDDKRNLGLYEGNKPPIQYLGLYNRNKTPTPIESIKKNIHGINKWIIPYSEVNLTLTRSLYKQQPFLGVDKYSFDAIPIYVKNSNYQKKGGKKSHKTRKNRRKLRKTR